MANLRSWWPALRQQCGALVMAAGASIGRGHWPTRLLAVGVLGLAGWVTFAPARNSGIDGQQISIHEIPDLTRDAMSDADAEASPVEPGTFDASATPVLAAPAVAGFSDFDAAPVQPISGIRSPQEQPSFAETRNDVDGSYGRFIQTADFEATAAPSGPAWLTGTIEIIAEDFRAEISPARR